MTTNSRCNYKSSLLFNNSSIYLIWFSKSGISAAQSGIINLGSFFLLFFFGAVNTFISTNFFSSGSQGFLVFGSKVIGALKLALTGYSVKSL